MLYCFRMFVNMLNNLRLQISKSKKHNNVKSSAYSFLVQTDILIDFQIATSLPFNYLCYLFLSIKFLFFNVF